MSFVASRLRISMAVADRRLCQSTTASALCGWRGTCGITSFGSRQGPVLGPKQLGGGSSRLLEQLRGPATPASATPAHGNRPSLVVAADRNFLLASAGGGHQVLLHDHRNLTFLKRITAGGVFVALMSSSGLVYALTFDFGPAACAGLALQTVGGFLLLVMYLRTYVARAVLDQRRAKLVLTGCGFFGEPLATDQQIPLMHLQPGASRSDHYIKFRIRGAAWDPSCWIWYRMPRASAEDGAARSAGAQVGFRASPAETFLAPAATEASLARMLSPASHTGRRFPGAGLGGVVGPTATAPVGPALLGSSPSREAAQSLGGTSTRENNASALCKSLAGLRLQHGLPANDAEEQKILDFFDDPTAYALVRS